MSRSSKVFLALLAIIFFCLPAFIFMDLLWIGKPFNEIGTDEFERLILLIYFSVSVFLSALIASKITGD